VTVKLHTNGFTVDADRRLLEFGDETVHVRPRAFALLLVLLRHPQQILSKDFLLKAVWDDVIVDEQVLFQTIGELRQLIRDPGLIKTYPRKGYTWSATVDEQTLEPAAQSQSTSRAFFNIRRLALFSFVPLTLAALVLIYVMYRPNISATEGPILVLPVKSTLADSDHNWVRLGAMDQLISALRSDGTVLALDTEYVLETLQRARLGRDIASEKVAQLFVVSGATMVVETNVSGSVEDYRLDYRLHFKNDLKRGTVFGATVAAAVHELAQIIARHPLIDERTGQTEFNNELMARALESKDAGDLAAAASLLASLKEMDTSNLAARRLFAQVLIDEGKTDAALAELASALTLADANAQEKPRLEYWQAVALVKDRKLERALQSLDAAERDAAERRNHLYLAYAAQLRGEIEQSLGQLERAQSAFDNAIRFHAIIRCPLGEALTRKQLAMLFEKKGALERAEQERAQVRKLAQLHALQGFETL
jgi:DNA-binding winged helix-turn-helix (wHTH) protein/tetratricopeptide (TPR) repeat protein